jgi:hypothetical protein
MSIRKPKTKDQPIVLKLEENRQLIGAIRFQFYANGSMFKIDSVVDSQCQPLNEFANVSRGGDKHGLQNYDDLQIQFGTPPTSSPASMERERLMLISPGYLSSLRPRGC